MSLQYAASWGGSSGCWISAVELLTLQNMGLENDDEITPIGRASYFGHLDQVLRD